MHYTWFFMRYILPHVDVYTCALLQKKLPAYNRYEVQEKDFWKERGKGTLQFLTFSINITRPFGCDPFVSDPRRATFSIHDGQLWFSAHDGCLDCVRNLVFVVFDINKNTLLC